MLRSIIFFLFFLVSLSHAQDEKYIIELKNNTFTPEVLHIPANTKVKINIMNLDSQPEEFDSFDLNREKVLFPNKLATIYIGPLRPGEYRYFGELHPHLAKGKIIVSDLSQFKSGE